MHFKHTSEHGVERFGMCGLCGEAKQLSKTHVPPKAAGNSGKASRSGVNLNTGELVQSRPREGGAWGYFLCEECNGATGNWDETLIEFVLEAGAHLLDEPNLEPITLQGQARWYRGRLVRSLLAGMFALSRGLQGQHPGLAKAVISGDAFEMPGNLDIAMAFTLDLPIIAVHQAGGVVVPPRGNGQLPPCLIHSPPISAALVEPGTPKLPHVSIGHWLEHSADDLTGSPLTVPFVTLVGERATIEAAHYRTGHSDKWLAHWRSSKSQ